MTFGEAIVECLDKGMSLAKFEDQDEFDAVTGLVGMDFIGAWRLHLEVFKHVLTF